VWALQCWRKVPTGPNNMTSDFISVYGSAYEEGKADFTDPMDIWQFKIRLLRKKVKGSSINTDAAIKKQKRELLKEFEKLDMKYEAGLLLKGDKDMDLIVQDLENIWNLEEIKARQRSRDRNVKEGDRNTSYFHALANQRARK